MPFIHFSKISNAVAVVEAIKLEHWGSRKCRTWLMKKLHRICNIDVNDKLYLREMRLLPSVLEAVDDSTYLLF